MTVKMDSHKMEIFAQHIRHNRPEIKLKKDAEELKHPVTCRLYQVI
jgi:hypothetical protein